MADFAIDAEVMNQLILDLCHCIDDCNQIPCTDILLDCLIKDQFIESADNETGREFLIEAYKDSLCEKATALEESLEAIRDQLKEIRDRQAKGKTEKRHPLVESSSYLAGISADK